MCAEPLGLLISVRQCARILHLDVFAKFHIPFWSVSDGFVELCVKINISFLECGMDILKFLQNYTFHFWSVWN